MVLSENISIKINQKRMSVNLTAPTSSICYPIDRMIDKFFVVIYLNIVKMVEYK